MAETFKLKVMTPTKEFYEGVVDMVEFTTTEGEVGVYANHIPMTSVIAPGLLKIHSNGEVKYAALISGFAQILQHTVTIMAEVCEWPDEIDEARAEEAKIRAERRMGENNPQIDGLRAEMALKRALVRINVKQGYR